MASAASQLLGMTLDGGWKVISPSTSLKHGTGGNFSVGYIVQNEDGREAFLKALDYSSALRAPDPARALEALTKAFNFERDVLSKCRGLDRVVTALADGSVHVSGAAEGVVQYLIFELAAGDVRAKATISKSFDLAWALRSTHHVATGIRQLHSREIAHQDLKPSNVLVFPDNVSKVSDLGRAAYKGHIPPHDVFTYAGDPTYAPPELRYGYTDPDWNKRRLGCDAYLLGSMVVFFFTGVGMTSLIEAELQPGHSWRVWGGTYQEVLPYVRTAFTNVVIKFENEIISQYDNSVLRDDLSEVVKQLCEPDPNLRGDPKNILIQANQFSLERYLSKFDYLARRAEMGLFKKVGH